MSGLPSIRHATKQDVPTILAFIKAGASDTNSLDLVKATESTLEQTLIFEGPSDQAASQSPRPGYARVVLLIAPEGETAGMAVYYYNYSTWRAEPGVLLEELYVRPEYRRRGYARQLIRELAKESKRINGSKVEWVCLRNNAPALKLYESLGAIRKEDWVTLWIYGDALDKLVGEE
ncbi:N-acetyltransferase [Coccidioides immitis H538.4]|uniref:N-acetyltransferase n=1 Tax=Coccidioides immitis H538.4 TaxID=396776 RepID=A0A0J8RMK0_COCIT|nr:N-acetyltransferase [Coccidioides immitis H538.4]